MQQVNLYQPAPRAAPAGVSAAAILRITLLAVLVMGAVYGYLLWRQPPLQAAYQALAERRMAAEAQLAGLTGQLAQRQTDPTLLQTLEARRDEQVLKARLLTVLADGTLGRTEGFGDHLAGLARQRVEGLWLTGLIIEQGGRRLTLEGSSLSPERVPQLLTRLGREPVFRGRAFRTLDITQPGEGGELRFTLSDGPGGENR